MGAFTGCAEFGLDLSSLKFKAHGESKAWWAALRSWPAPWKLKALVP